VLSTQGLGCRWSGQEPRGIGGHADLPPTEFTTHLQRRDFSSLVFSTLPVAMTARLPHVSPRQILEYAEKDLLSLLVGTRYQDTWIVEDAGAPTCFGGR